MKESTKFAEQINKFHEHIQIWKKKNTNSWPPRSAQFVEEVKGGFLGIHGHHVRFSFLSNPRTVAMSAVLCYLPCVLLKSTVSFSLPCVLFSDCRVLNLYRVSNFVDSAEALYRVPS
jgi:hypothetical protein